jgi:hypothetical protein
MRKQIGLAVVLALGAGTAAQATTPEEEQACTNDAFQFCQAYIPDRERVFNCLVTNRQQISVACHTVLTPYLPAEPVVAAATKKPSALRDKGPDKGVKTKGPLNLAPH